MQNVPDLVQLGRARKPLILGYATAAMLAVSVWIWGVSTHISGAVIAQGILQPEYKRQVVQHLRGGTVSRILARDGVDVGAGEPLVLLDDTELQAQLKTLESQYASLLLRKARWLAELKGSSILNFADDPSPDAVSDPQIARWQKDQSEIFELRLETFAQQRAQIRAQQDQIKSQISGLRAQLQSANEQNQLAMEEIEDVQSLLERGLAKAPRLTALKRETAALRGQIGQITASITQLTEAHHRLKTQDQQLHTTRKQEASAALEELSIRELDLSARLAATRSLIEKTTIRSPVAGTVFESRIVSENAVLQPAEPIMYIIPSDQPLVAMVQVPARQIDQIYTGQPAEIRIPNVHRFQDESLFGTVANLSADAVATDTNPTAVFQVKVSLSDWNAAHAQSLTLRAGLPVEVFFKTRDQTPLSYVIQPLAGYFSHAFRERQ